MNQFHLVWNKALRSNKLFIRFYFKHEYNRQLSDKVVKLNILEAVVKGYHRCSFAVRVGDKFVVKQNRGERGLALRVTGDDRGHKVEPVTSIEFDWVQQSNLIELTKKLQFDYVRLPNQSSSNRIDWDWLGSIGFWFGFVRLSTPGLHQGPRRDSRFIMKAVISGHKKMDRYLKPDCIFY